MEERQRLANINGMWQCLLLLLIFSIRFRFTWPNKNRMRDKNLFGILPGYNFHHCKSVKIQLLYQLNNFIFFFYSRKRNKMRTKLWKQVHVWTKYSEKKIQRRSLGVQVEYKKETCFLPLFSMGSLFVTTVEVISAKIRRGRKICITNISIFSLYCVRFN